MLPSARARARPSLPDGSRRTHTRAAPGASHLVAATGGRRLPRDDQAEGAVAAALHHGHHDVRGGHALSWPGAAHLPRRRAGLRRRGGDQPLPRPRHRRLDDPHRPPAGAVRACIARRGVRLWRRARHRVLTLLALTVNVLAAALALSGLLGYVLVY